MLLYVYVLYIVCMFVYYIQYTLESLHQEPDCCTKTVLVSLAWGWSLHPINWKLIVVFLVIAKVRSNKSTDICFCLVETHQCGTLLLFSLLLAVVDWNNNYTQQLHKFIKKYRVKREEWMLWFIIAGSLSQMPWVQSHQHHLLFSPLLFQWHRFDLTQLQVTFGKIVPWAAYE